jgi:hypothetical protein
MKKEKTVSHFTLRIVATLWSLAFSAHGIDLADSPGEYRGVNAWPVGEELVRLGVDPNAPPRFDVVTV